MDIEKACQVRLHDISVLLKCHDTLRSSLLPAKDLNVDGGFNHVHQRASDTKEGGQVNSTLAELIAKKGIDFSNQGPFISVRVAAPELGQETGGILLLGIGEQLQIVG